MPVRFSVFLSQRFGAAFPGMAFLFSFMMETIHKRFDWKFNFQMATKHKLMSFSISRIFCPGSRASFFCLVLFILGLRTRKNSWTAHKKG